MDNNKDIEMATKPSTGTDNAISSTDTSKDRPPTPPKRDHKADDFKAESEVKRRTTRLFPRPEVIYKPENTKSWMSCLKGLLILFNLLIWLFGAVLTGIGIWMKVDSDFWEIQTNFDIKQFSTSTTILITVGVVIMIIGFFGCYGAYADSLCMLITYAVVITLIIILEIAAVAIVWSAMSNKDFKEEIKSKAKRALQDMAKVDHQRYFLDLVQARFKCCGIDGPDDYSVSEGPESNKMSPPKSCTNTETGSYYEKGCLEPVVSYLKSKAGMLGGIAVGVLILQVAALVFTCCVACGIKNAAQNAIF